MEVAARSAPQFPLTKSEAVCSTYGMGVEFTNLLIPRDNTFRPDGAAVRRLIAAWRQSNFVVAPGSAAQQRMSFDGMTDYASAAKTGASLQTPSEWRSFEDAYLDAFDALGGEFIIQWPVQNRRESGITHPLADIDETADSAYYDLELHFSDDFVDVQNEMIFVEEAQCSCGEDLQHDHSFDDLARGADIFYAGRVRRACPNCGELFRPQDHTALYTHGITGAESELPGGAMYRFAIVIDCGKCWRTISGEKDAIPVARKEFIETCSAAIGAPLYQVGYFY